MILNIIQFIIHQLNNTLNNSIIHSIIQLNITQFIIPPPTHANLLQALRNFATSNKLMLTRIPRISVKDVGQLSFPLPTSQDAQLREKSSQAPFGIGSDTVVFPTIQFSVLEFRKPPVLDAKTDIHQDKKIFNRNFELNIYVVVCMQ